MASQTRYYVKPSDAEAFAQSLLLKAGLPDDHALLMAKCLVQADTRGVDTHGMARLQQYMDRVTAGLVNARPALALSAKTPVAAHLDGDNGFGFVVATAAMAAAIARADTYGIGIVTASRSNHFGMAATYVLQALAAGMLALVFTNSAKQMPPFGGRDVLLGIPPFAAGTPAGAEPPYVLDMAPSVVAKGKVRRAARRGEPIPLGWACDEHGRPTTDAAAALKGSMAPIGGPKGSGIAILVDVMAGVLSGAAFGGDVGDQYADARPQNVGHCFVAIKPDVFMSAGEFRRRMDELVRRVHGVAPAEGFDEVLFPGEPEWRLAKEREVQGLPFADAEKDMFDEMAKKYGVPALAYSTEPLRL